jgi:drug/metabolite transporter (DMT)-like permease
MKSISQPMLLALVLSTISWLLLYLAFPDAPPGPDETFLIVFGFAVIAFAVVPILRRLRTRRKRRANEATLPK